MTGVKRAGVLSQVHTKPGVHVVRCSTQQMNAHTGTHTHRFWVVKGAACVLKGVHGFKRTRCRGYRAFGALVDGRRDAACTNGPLMVDMGLWVRGVH